MKNEITPINKTELVESIGLHGITDMIKPLVKEIELFETHVAGTSYTDPGLLSALKTGDKLILRREKDNKFDDLAVKFLNSDEVKIGYIPEKDNEIFARLMDAGKLLSAKIKNISNKGSYVKIDVTIFLVDF